MAKDKVWPVLRRFLREFALFGVLFVAITLWQTRHAASGQAPALEAHGLDGPVSLAARTGPVAVHFWATWCGVCRAEEGSIESFSKDRSLVSIAVQSGEAADVDAYRKKSGLTFATVNDPEGTIAAEWGVSSFPTTFFLDRNGEIRSVSVGWTSGLGLRARMWWASLFG